MNKKGMDVKILATIIVCIFIFSALVYMSVKFRDTTTDAVKEDFDFNILSDQVNKYLDTGAAQVEYDAIDDIPQEFKDYTRLVIDQMFNPEYARPDPDRDEEYLYQNKNKNLRYYDYFNIEKEVFKKYSIWLQDSSEGISVFIIDDLNVPRLFATYENYDFLKNKHLAVVKFQTSNKDLEYSNFYDFSTLFTLREQCPILKNSKNYEGTFWSELGTELKSLVTFVSSLDSSFSYLDRGKTASAMIRLQNTFYNYDVKKNDASLHVVPVKTLQISRANDKRLLSDDTYCPELSWVSESGEVDYQHMVNPTNNENIPSKYFGHLILRLDPDESKKLAQKQEFKTNNAEFIAFYPSIAQYLKCESAKGICFYDVKSNNGKISELYMDGRGPLGKYTNMWMIIAISLNYCN